MRAHQLSDGGHGASAPLPPYPSASPRRQDGALDFAEADAVAVALAPAAHDQRIAVLEKGSLDAAFEFDRLGAVPAYFEQAAALMLFRSADGAAAEEIADIHGAATGGVVHQLLDRRPVHVPEIGAADRGGLLHGRRAQGHLELEIVIVGL